MLFTLSGECLENRDGASLRSGIENGKSDINQTFYQRDFLFDVCEKQCLFKANEDIFPLHFTMLCTSFHVLGFFLFSQNLFVINLTVL